MCNNIYVFNVYTGDVLACFILFTKIKANILTAIVKQLSILILMEGIL